MEIEKKNYARKSVDRRLNTYILQPSIIDGNWNVLVIIRTGANHNNLRVNNTIYLPRPFFFILLFILCNIFRGIQLGLRM